MISENYNNGFYSVTRGFFSNNEKRPILLLWWIICISIHPFVKKFDLGIYLQYYDKVEEALLILVFPYLLRGLLILWNIRIWGPITVFAYLCYLFWGSLSWLFSPLKIEAFALQFLLELKMPILAMAFIGAGDTKWIIKKFLPYSKMILLLSIALIIWQFVLPESYNTFFSAGAHQGAFFLLQERLPRAAGIFWHPGQLATFSATMCGFYIIQLGIKKGKKQLLWIILSFFVLLTTFSRNETFAMIIGLLVVYFFFRREKFYGEKFISFTVLTGLLYFILIPIILPYVKFTMYNELGFLDFWGARAARVAFYAKSFLLANIKFPLGGGLGGYGGHAADVYSSPYYLYLGFQKYWWFQRNTFLTDTFWPHVIGESGWFGFFSYCLCLFALFKILVGKLSSKIIKIGKSSIVSANFYTHYVDTKQYMFSALLAFTILIVNSVTAPVFTDLFSLWLGLMFLGSIQNGDAELNGYVAPVDEL